jgi:hypothetical protein
MQLIVKNNHFIEIFNDKFKKINCFVSLILRINVYMLKNHYHKKSCPTLNVLN